MRNFNLEKEYGSFLEGVRRYLDEDDVVEHYGVKGMKWGVRKERDLSKEVTGLGPSQVSVKTRNGETLTLTKDRPNAIVRFIARRNEKYRNNANDFASLTITDSSGKKVGDASLTKVNKDEINLIWLGIKNSERGQGYASATMKAAVDFGKQAGVKRLTLEVPGNSPDARHIYEKLGFKVVKEDLDPTDSMWGGLSDMVYDFDEARHSTMFNSMTPTLNRGYHAVELMADADSIAHFGVKGMKWGVRKDQGGSSPKVTRRQNRQMNKEAAREFYAKKAEAIFREAKKGGDDVLIETILAGDNIKTITTGKEFATHLEAGGLMNIKATEIFARKNTNLGQYELNENRTGNYQKQNFRKP